MPTFNAWADGSDHKHFMLRGILMWTVSNFLAYGLISGQQTKRYHGCPCCRPFTDSKRIRGPNGDKIVYLGMRKWLPAGHDYRANKRFNDRNEHGTALPHLSSADILQYVEEREHFILGGSILEGLGDPVHYMGVKRQSVLYDLPYWKILSLFCCFFFFPFPPSRKSQSFTHLVYIWKLGS